MTSVAVSVEQTQEAVSAALGVLARNVSVALDEVTVVVAAKDYRAAMQKLRTDARCAFEQLIDLCGVDYSTYAEGTYEGLRFAVVSHLLSVSLNQRVRVKVFVQTMTFPWWFLFPIFGILPIGLSVKPLISTVSCLTVILTCVVS